MLEAFSIVGVVFSSVLAFGLYVCTWLNVFDDLYLCGFGGADYPIFDGIWIVVNTICLMAWFIWSWITVLM